MQYVAEVVTQYFSSLSSFVTNLRLLSQVVADKSLTEKNVHMYFIGVAEGKNEKLKKEGKMRISILIFNYTIHIAYLKVFTKYLKHWLQLELRKQCQKFSMEIKKNEQIKGLISNMWLFLLHNTTHHYQALYQISQS